MSSVKVEQLPVPCLYLGEGPHWQAEFEALLYVDIFSKAVCRYFINTGRQQVLYIDDGGKAMSLNHVVPVEGLNDWYVVAVGNTLCGVHWKISDPDKHTIKPKIIQEVPDTFFNDGKCDPQGRLWAGTVGLLDGEQKVEMYAGNLYRLNSDLSITKCVDKVSASNGMTWSPNKKSFYYIDSEAFSVSVFHYDDPSGTIDNRRVLLDYKKSNLGEDVPDGMTCDIDGNLWVANFKGSKVICVNPVTGQIIHKVIMPCKNVTSVCWGGPDYATLFVTSGKFQLTPQEIKDMPAAGATFAVTGLGTKGSPPNFFRPNIDLFKAKMGI